MTSKVRVGIMGVGIPQGKPDEYGVGSRHAQAYSRCKDADLVAVCDLKKERADLIAKRYRTESYTDLEKMISENSLDLVSVCTPMDKHFRPTVTLLESGINVLCEKPLATNIKEAKTMLGKARKERVQLGVNFNRRQSVPWMTAKKEIDSGHVGQISHVLLCFKVGPCQFMHLPPYEILYQYHSHAFDMFRHLVGEIEQVYARLSKVDTEAPTYKQASITLRFRNGAMGYLIGSGIMPPHGLTGGPQYEEFSEIVGTKETLIVRNVVDSIEIRDHETQSNVVKETPASERYYDATLDKSISCFVRCVATGKAFPIGGADGMKTLQLIEASCRSFEDGVPIELY